MDAVYKIMTQLEWEDFQARKTFAGSELDLKDGYIHLSTKDQVSGVVERHLKGIRPLFIVKFTSKELLHSLKWEKSASGGTYPHLYDRELKLAESESWEKLV